MLLGFFLNKKVTCLFYIFRRKNREKNKRNKFTSSCGNIVRMLGINGNSKMVFITDPNDFDYLFRYDKIPFDTNGKLKTTNF